MEVSREVLREILLLRPSSGSLDRQVRYALEHRNAELEAALAEEKARYAADRKHHYGDGYPGASIKMQGRIQELEARVKQLEQQIRDEGGEPEPPQQEQ